MRELSKYRAGSVAKVKVQITGLTPPYIDIIVNEVKGSGNSS
ncbi:MAG: hypothetical protein ACP5NQ_09045 [Vulcanisaeta sp.]